MPHRFVKKKGGFYYDTFSTMLSFASALKPTCFATFVRRHRRQDRERERRRYGKFAADIKAMLCMVLAFKVM
jgi:hypothetical protein